MAHGRGFFGIRKAGLKELRKQRMGDPLKIELAGELRKQTAVSMGGIAKELNAGGQERDGIRSGGGGSGGDKLRGKCGCMGLIFLF